jgi:hypothetical protein
VGRWVIAVVAGLLVLPAAAVAAPLGLTSCADVEGVHQCSGLVRTWDGVPLDTTVTLPARGARDLPLVVDVHGFGNSKHEYLDPASEAYTGNAFGWAKRGYAVLTYTARGLWGSCGTPDSRAADPAGCARGWIHLADVRFEVRDTQELVGRLVDEGTADAGRIGVTGDSYGGGQTFMLAALRDRVMLPDGSLVPWRSPRGTPLSLAAAAPVIPWTDLVSAIAPNGRTVTHAIMPQRQNSEPVGVFKTSFANAIAAAAQFATGPGQPVGQPFVPGRPMGYLAPAGADPQSDVLGWVARADAGEPYDDARTREIVDLLSRFHSAYGIPADRPPPPLFVGSGFTDDLFPVDEVIRFTERMRRDHPRVPVSLYLGDFGHQRAGNKPADRERLLTGIRSWFDAYVKRAGERPPAGVVATTQTCPRERPSEGPFAAPAFAGLARGEVRFATRAPQTVTSDGTGDPSTAAAVDPAAGGGDGCRASQVTEGPGTAVASLPASPGYTLLEAPTIVARLKVTGEPGAAQLALRLWDVAPGGDRQTLVARGTYRPVGGGAEVFQLHPAAWRFAPGHVPRLEVLGADAPYTRASNGTFSVTIERLELRLPVREAPDCATVLPAAERVAPPGQALVAASEEVAACGPAATPRGPRMVLRLRCGRRGVVASATVRGARVRRVDFLLSGRRVARDTRAPFLRSLRRRGRVRVTARASLRGRPSVRATARSPRCARRR